MSNHMDRRTFFGSVAALAVGSQVKADNGLSSCVAVSHSHKLCGLVSVKNEFGQWELVKIMRPVDWDYSEDAHV